MDVAVQKSALTGLKYYHIVAINRNYGIGIKNQLPWHSKADLQHFKLTTMGQILIVGRKTYDSLPSSKLKGRHLIVLSRSMTSTDLPEHVRVVRSIHDAYLVANELATEWALNRVYIAGGAEIYRATANVIDGAIVSRIDDVQVCDAFYAPTYLRFMACVMNKSLKVDEGDLGVDVHEYAMVDLTKRGAEIEWQYHWGCSQK